MLERCAMAMMLALSVAAAGTATAGPLTPQPALDPIAAPVVPAPAPYITVQQGGRVEIETDGKTIVFQPSGNIVTIETYGTDQQLLSSSLLTADPTALPTPIDVDWKALSAAVSPVASCESISATMATIDYGDHSNPSMSCGMAMATLAAATVAVGAACAGPQAATGACAAAIVMYLYALDNYYNSCSHYLQEY